MIAFVGIELYMMKFGRGGYYFLCMVQLNGVILGSPMMPNWRFLVCNIYAGANGSKYRTNNDHGGSISTVTKLADDVMSQDDDDADDGAPATGALTM
jgi:hypothetical protein